ncbi:hypothetical protein OYT88_15590 [Sporolactobacillus sp. CQH2019]|uniref:hypothetical protein n=1 Tax=Sporolactobacillus sp. CQH2019 TaxID=3023512 RepID=UPI002367A558|nr:hypothetical protein [Sporolactobacillus sp. CQH2019]MDD9149974.1 hypothetical protein [Sporolactobacillus sp. CQH2019]
MARFKIEYINAQAEKEFYNLDGSVRIIIQKAYRRLEYRADEIGKPLSGNLYQCKEIKLRHIGIRIVFRLIGWQIQVVQIIAINKREDDQVFGIAEDRIKNRLNFPTTNLRDD